MPPVRAAGDGVKRVAVGQLRDVVRDQALDGLGGARPAKVDLTHVADVEDAHGRPGRAVLVDDPRRIAHRHPPAAEVDDLRAGAPVRLVKRRLSGCGRRGVGLAVIGAPILRETPINFKDANLRRRSGPDCFDVGFSADRSWKRTRRN